MLVNVLVNVQAQIVHPFGIFLATLKNSGKIPTFLQNVGILPEHKKYAGSDLLADQKVRAGIFLMCHQISGKLPSICATMNQLNVGAHLNN